MKYIIWTLAEEHALCQALAHAWLKYGVKTVDQDNFRTLIKLAGPDLSKPEPDSVLSTTGDWRTRTLKSRDARNFIEKNREVLEGLMNSGENRGYIVEGYEQPMTVKQMQDEIVRLNAELKALKEPQSPPSTPTVTSPIAESPAQEACDGTYRPQALTPKTRVAIAGLHDKHRDNIARAFPHLIITWIESRDNDSLIKSKASGRPAIACTHGTNGKVLRLLHNISAKFFQVGGASGVRETLANASFQ